MDEWPTLTGGNPPYPGCVVVVQSWFPSLSLFPSLFLATPTRLESTDALILSRLFPTLPFFGLLCTPGSARALIGPTLTRHHAGPQQGPQQVVSMSELILAEI